MSNYPKCVICQENHKQCSPAAGSEPDIGFIPTPRHEQRLYIDQRLDGLNEIIKADRTHWSVGSKLKKAQQEIVGWAIKRCSLKPVKGPFRLEIFYSEPNTDRDPDNIASSKKFILDALQELNIIPNDNQTYVLGWQEAWGVATKDRPVGVHIKIIED